MGDDKRTEVIRNISMAVRDYRREFGTWPARMRIHPAWLDDLGDKALISELGQKIGITASDMVLLELKNGREELGKYFVDYWSPGPIWDDGAEEAMRWCFESLRTTG